MSGQTTDGSFAQILRDKLKNALENYEQHLIKETDYEAITWELMTLLDRIECDYDDTLASQRFDIMKKHGLNPEFGQIVSARQQ